MSDFFKIPHLPDDRVALALCGKTDNIIADYIKSYGISLIFAETNIKLDVPVSNHIDINVHHLGGKNIILSSNQYELYKILTGYGMNVILTDEEVRSPYPYDCILNCFKLKDYLFCNKNISDEIIKALAGVKIANVNQGYCKCSTLIIDENSFITDDATIYSKGTELGFDCLMIEKGDVALEGYNYGFIGGASAKIDKNTVMFFGDITKHRDFNIIDQYLKRKGIEYVYSDKFCLTDIGGIIPLK